MPASTPKPATNQIDRRRRRHPRYAADFRVTVSYLLENQYQKLEGHCRDLSEAGIGILLAAEMNSGEVVGLSYLVPGSADPWEVRAVVRYRRGYQYGFEFLSLTGGQQRDAEELLQGPGTDGLKRLPVEAGGAEPASDGQFGMTSVILWSGDLWFKLKPGLVRANERTHDFYE